MENLSYLFKYHVIAGKVMAADLSDGLQVNTVQGSSVTFKLSASGAMINGANIVTTDIETANGVIHVIDAVLLPPANEPEVLPVTGSGLSYGTGLLAVMVGMLVLGAASVIARRRLI